MRRSGAIFLGTAIAALLMLGGCGSEDDGGSGVREPGRTVATIASSPAGETNSPTPVSLQAEFTAPKPDHVLQISVQSATRTGNQIVLVLTGTYGGNSSTLWDHTTVVANSDTGTCSAKATPGFPPGTHPRSSVVNGTWTLSCPGSGSIQLVIDPYGGLLSNASFLLVLR